MLPDFDAWASGPAPSPPAGTELGRSRQGRPVLGWRLGRGEFRVSLIAGCHADEPVGPELLRRLVTWLASLPASDDVLGRFDWWIVPHANPDGAAANAAWVEPLGEVVDPVAWLRNAVREAPGDDVEFGFPRDPGDDDGARPENRAIAAWWRGAPGPFRLHASLHGMAIAWGPWFLIEEAWRDRIGLLLERCRDATARLGRELHDVDRGGEKGFVRIAPGFATRPDSQAMASFFRDRGDEVTAALFRPSSMETVRALGGDPLTLVSEIPLFVLPARPEPGPATPAMMETWKDRFGQFRKALLSRPAGEVRREIAEAGVVPMPVADQMRL